MGGTGGTTPLRRTLVPWLAGLAALLTVLAPLLLLGLWVGGTGLGEALLVALADLVAAVIAAAVATVLLVRRGVRRVRSVVHGHPDGRAGRLAEHGRARWLVARDRFAALASEYASVESDPREVAARPALVDVRVPETGRFVEALADAHALATDTEPADPAHRDRFVAAVERASATWGEACRAAEALAIPRPGADPGPTWSVGHVEAGRAEADRSEYGVAAEAVRKAAVRGARDLRDRLRTM
jgi:hypothetical protein